MPVKLSTLQKKYVKFFREKLRKYKVTKIKDLSDKDKSKFFTEIEKDWTLDTDALIDAVIQDRVKNYKIDLIISNTLKSHA